MDKKELLKEHVEKDQEYETIEETNAKIREFLRLNEDLIEDFVLFPKMSKHSLKQRYKGIIAIKKDMDNPQNTMHYDGDENLRKRTEYLVNLYSKYTEEQVLDIFDQYNKYGIA